MKIQVSQITAPKSRLTKEAKAENDFDTGVFDGSGNLNVRAGSAEQRGNDVVFFNCEIEVNPPKDWDGSGHPYIKWSEGNLTTEAAEMLKRDYCK